VAAISYQAQRPASSLWLLTTRLPMPEVTSPAAATSAGSVSDELYGMLCVLTGVSSVAATT
jgi:hypothetical protein